METHTVILIREKLNMQGRHILLTRVKLNMRGRHMMLTCVKNSLPIDLQAGKP